jgi:predicted nucleic acid-binding protein
LEKDYQLYTVANALAECLNAIWKHATLLKDLNVEDTKTATDYLLQTFARLNVANTPDLAKETMAIAQTLKVPVYDALYIALAKKEKGTLYTSDQKLAKTAKTTTTTKLLKPN